MFDLKTFSLFTASPFTSFSGNQSVSETSIGGYLANMTGVGSYEIRDDGFMTSYHEA